MTHTIENIAIFKDAGPRGQWTWRVGHIPSGLGLPNGNFKTLKQAKAYALELQSVFDLSGDSSESIIYKSTGMLAIRPTPHDPAHAYNSGINLLAQFRDIAQKHGGV